MKNFSLLLLLLLSTSFLWGQVDIFLDKNGNAVKINPPEGYRLEGIEWGDGTFSDTEKEKNLSQKKFNERDFNEIEPEELYEINKSYNENVGKLTEYNIRKLSIKNFFRSSWDLSENAYYYFGKPLSQITYFQTNLASNATTFGNIFKNYPGIDSEDPDEIIEFAQMRQQAEKKGGKNRNFVGADSDKLKRAGIQSADRSNEFKNIK